MLKWDHQHHPKQRFLMRVLHERPAVFSLAGSIEDVRAQLDRLGKGNAILLSLSDIQPPALQALAANLKGVTESMYDALTARHSQQSIDALVDILTPREVASPLVMRQAQAIIRARKGVLDSGDFLTAAQVAEAAGLSGKNPSSQPHKWKTAGQIFALKHNNVDYYPGYGLDADRFRPLEGMAPVLEVLKNHKDSWGLAYWFLSANGPLGGRRPKDVLATDPQSVLEAARREVGEMVHG
jgi:hypothetical protein